jgi:predicted metal-dependent hydrolase
LLKGIEQFNRGEYWECHETLEQLWMAEPGPLADLYQGILQIGVAFHHLHEHNYPGTIKMLRRGLPKLRGYPAVCHGVHAGSLLDVVRTLHDALAAAGPDRIGEFAATPLPIIAVTHTTAR